MLRVSSGIEGEREQDLISPDARQGSLMYRLRKNSRPLTDGQGRNSATSLRTGRGRNTATGVPWASACSGVMSRLRRRLVTLHLHQLVGRQRRAAL